MFNFAVWTTIIAAVGLVFCNDIQDEAESNPIKVNELFVKIPLLTDDNIGDFIKAVKNDEEHFIFFYADWCPACHDFKPALNLLIESEFFDNHGITVYRVDVDSSPELTARFFITSLPTLIHIREGQFHVITSKRWKIIEYFDNKEWLSVEPIRSWMSPMGYFAGCLGFSTRLGHRVAKEATALNWPKWKWAVAFFLSFVVAWGPVVYFGLLKGRNDIDISSSQVRTSKRDVVSKQDEKDH